MSKLSSSFGRTRPTTSGMTGEDADAHGAYLAGILTTIEEIHTTADTLRKELRSDRAVKLRGIRWAGLPFAASAANIGRPIVLSSSAVEWGGLLLTETSGTGPMSVMVGDGDNSGADPIGQLNFVANETKLFRWQTGVALYRGIVLTATAGTGTVTGSVFLR